jgi:hypothetical protein
VFIGIICIQKNTKNSKKEIAFSLFFDEFLRQVLITAQPQSERASIFRTYLLEWDANVTANTAHVTINRSMIFILKQERFV